MLWFKRSPRPDRRRDRTGVGLDDPSLLYSANGGHRGSRYEELTDLEGQKGAQTKRGGLEGFPDTDVSMATVGIADRVA